MFDTKCFLELWFIVEYTTKSISVYFSLIGRLVFQGHDFWYITVMCNALLLNWYQCADAFLWCGEILLRYACTLVLLPNLSVLMVHWWKQSEYNCILYLGFRINFAQSCMMCAIKNANTLSLALPHFCPNSCHIQGHCLQTEALLVYRARPISLAYCMLELGHIGKSERNGSSEREKWV